MLARGKLLVLLIAMVSLVTPSIGHGADQLLTMPSTNTGSMWWLHSPSIQGDDSALVNPNGHVTVVTLIQANSAYSRRQAQRLNSLSSDVRTAATASSGDDNGADLHVIGINSRNFLATHMINELTDLVNFTVYQATQQDDHWSRLGGYKDDVFIYDRCGNLAYYVPFPRSYVPYRFVEAAILSTLHDNPCATWQTPTPVSSVNCTNSTDVNRMLNGTTEAVTTTTDVCAEYTKQKCETLQKRRPLTEASKLALRCCRRHRHHHHPHHGNQPTASGHHLHHATQRRCTCLPTSPSTVQHSCLCRPTTPTSPSCYCLLSSEDFIRHCSSCHNEDWSTSSDTASTCSCHINQQMLSADQCSWDNRPVPYGRHAGLNSATSELWRQSSRPLLWPQASWSWPVSADKPNATTSWSWRMELTGNGDQLRPSPVSWSWANHQGRPVQGVSEKSWSWSQLQQQQQQGAVATTGWNVFGWQCKEGVTSWSDQMQWRVSSDRSECSWQGCLVKTSKEQPATTWVNDPVWWSAEALGAWQTNWQRVTWSWDSAEARTRLWQQLGQTIDWQQSGWREVAGWQWHVNSGSEENAGEKWSSGSQTGWLSVWGWKWGNAVTLVRESWSESLNASSWVNGRQWWSAGTWATWSASSWQTNWQQVRWSWDSHEARTRLWQQLGQTLDWQQSGWRVVAGWQWQVTNGSEQNGSEKWSSGSQTGWLSVWGWKWGGSLALVRESWKRGNASTNSWATGQQWWSASSWQQANWQLVKWSWDSVEAQTGLWQQLGQTIDWQQSGWREVAGWQWRVNSGSEESVREKWSSGSQTGWFSVWGWKWGQSFTSSDWS